MKLVKGGICAPKGFSANGIHCGIRKNNTKKDLALILSDKISDCACVYTTNLVKGAPLDVTKENIQDGKAQAVIVNSGNANTCNDNGIEIAKEMCSLAASSLNISASDVVVASTGVIGEKLNITPIKDNIDNLASKLSTDGSRDAAEAIMTTDTIVKEFALEFEVGGKICHIGGIAKGSGMIHPNMATMLVFITTDVNISSEMLSKVLKSDIQNTFNMISVDGDTSTNDMVCVMANGMAGNERIESEGDEFMTFAKALNTLNIMLCELIAADGEGATKLIDCKVNNADSIENARIIAKSVISSSLVKTAMFGSDANWGRILCAIGYSKAKVDIDKIDVYFESGAGKICVCENGHGLEFSEEKAKEILLEDKIDIIIDLKSGEYSATAWGCDLTYDYVKINGDYRT